VVVVEGGSVVAIGVVGGLEALLRVGVAEAGEALEAGDLGQFGPVELVGVRGAGLAGTGRDLAKDVYAWEIDKSKLIKDFGLTSRFPNPQ